MCHGNYFLFFCCTLHWGTKRTPPIMFAHMTRLSVGYHDTPRAPHRYDGPFFILEKTSRIVERDSANVCASSRVHSDPLEIAGDHNGVCDVIPPDYFVIPFASRCVSPDPRKEFNSKLNILSEPISNRIFGIKRIISLQSPYKNSMRITTSVNIWPLTFRELFQFE